MMLKKVGKSFVYLTKVKHTVCMIYEDMDNFLLLAQHKNKLIFFLCKHHTSYSIHTFQYKRSVSLLQL